MCGICGIVRNDGRRVDESVLDRMRDTLVHRGPDDWGNHIDETVGLAATRLAIIDVEGGHMPIHNEDRSIWVTYNGEIYNHGPLRKELEDEGHRFYTRTDTEMVVHAYEAYGEECVKRFNGMFAFAIWDRNTHSLFMARDQLGIKPLYYMWHQGTFLFASEIKALLEYPGVVAEVEPRALSVNLALGYVPEPLTMFRGIHKLPAAHTLRLNGSAPSVKRYWAPSHQPVNGRSPRSLTQELRGHVVRSVESRLMSDVPLGVLLSGGIDSTVIAGVMSRVLGLTVDTFTVGFSEPGMSTEKYNADQKHARVAAESLGTRHHELFVSPADNLPELLHQTVYRMEQPVYAPTLLPIFLVSELARKNVTVALTGDGSDELFAGYAKFRGERAVGVYSHLPRWLRSAMWKVVADRAPLPRKVRNVMARAQLDVPVERYLSWKYIFEVEQQAHLRTDGASPPAMLEDITARLAPYFPDRMPRDFTPHFAWAELSLWVRNHICDAADRMSLAHSLELRPPFLDHELVEFAQTVPFNLKLRGNTTKWILKEAFADVLPAQLVSRAKVGFPTPAAHWLRTHLRGLVDEVLSPRAIQRAGVFNPDYVTALVNGHMDKSRYAMLPVWHLLAFQLWHEMFIQKRRPAPSRVG